jgi:hypothetical protein
MKIILLITICSLFYFNWKDNDYPFLTNVTGFDCDSAIFSKDSINPVITNYKQNSDGLIEISVVFGENCGQVKNGMLEVHGDTLNLKYDDKKIFTTNVITTDSIETKIEYVVSDYAFCDCLFELTYFIQGFPDKEYTYKLNGKLIKTRPNNGEHP